MGQFKKNGLKSVRWTVAGVLVATGLAVGYLCTQQMGVKSLLQTPDEFFADGRKFFLFKDDEADFETAQGHCRSLGLELAPVKTEVVLNAIASRIPDTVWIGLKNLKPELEDAKDGWAFDDGSEYDMATLPWFEGEPNGDGKECALLNADGLLRDYWCNTTLNFVCEDLSSRWLLSMLYADTFVAVKARNYGYNGAQAFCQRMGSHLAVIRTQAENHEISVVLQNLGVDTAWVGLTHESGAWKRVDGKDPADLWAANEQSGAGSKSRAVLDSGLQMWRKRDYHSLTHGFVCEGYEWALVHKASAISWTAANDFCEAIYGTSLTTVHDSDVNSEMAGALQHYGEGATAFIGLSDAIGEEGEWRWIDESPKTFQQFGPWLFGEGEHVENAEDCAALQADGHWLDTACDSSSQVHNFFCASMEDRGPECWCQEADSGIGTLVAVHRDVFWEEAQGYCEKHGLGHLASIHKASENEDVRQCLAVCGLTKGWIGLNQSVAADYGWSDASDMDFVNWANGKPQAFEHVFMQVEGELEGQWHNVAGGVNKYGFVCKPGAGRVRVYRYFRSSPFDHLYTTELGEAATAGYVHEGEDYGIFYLFERQVPDSVPLYRYYQHTAGDSLYTTDASEIGTTTVGDVGTDDYEFIEILGYCYPTPQPATAPLYRFFNAGLVDHIYPVIDSERDRVAANTDWQNQGIECYTPV